MDERKSSVGFNSKHLFQSFRQCTICHLPWWTCSEYSVIARLSCLLAIKALIYLTVTQRSNFWTFFFFILISTDDKFILFIFSCCIEFIQLITVSENIYYSSRDNTRGYTCREHPFTVLPIGSTFLPMCHITLFDFTGLWDRL